MGIACPEAGGGRTRAHHTEQTQLQLLQGEGLHYSGGRYGGGQTWNALFLDHDSQRVAHRAVLLAATRTLRLRWGYAPVTRLLRACYVPVTPLALSA